MSRATQENYAEKADVAEAHYTRQLASQQGLVAAQPLPHDLIHNAIRQVDAIIEQLMERISVDEDKLFETKARLESNRIALETFRETRKSLAIGINALNPKDSPYPNSPPSTLSGAARPANY